MVSSAPVAAPAVAGAVSRPWTYIALVEVVLGGAAVLLDLLIPSLVLLVLATVSLGIRRQGLGSLGLVRPTRDHLVIGTATFAVLWSVFQLAVTIPVANHLSGRRQDMGVFEDVEGNLGLLLVLVLLSWTLAAFVEEVAFRGFLFTRLQQVAGHTRAGTLVAVLASSGLFGALHSEQGMVGVVIVALDAMAFCVLRLHFGTLWAPVLAHGFNNTLGLVTFFFAGPLYGLW